MKEYIKKIILPLHTAKLIDAHLRSSLGCSICIFTNFNVILFTLKSVFTKPFNTFISEFSFEHAINTTCPFTFHCNFNFRLSNRRTLN